MTEEIHRFIDVELGEFPMHRNTRIMIDGKLLPATGIEIHVGEPVLEDFKRGGDGRFMQSEFLLLRVPLYHVNFIQGEDE